MFEVRDDWNRIVRRFEDREDAMDYIRQRGAGKLHLNEGE